MSAIWGILHLNGKEADYEEGMVMERAMNSYKFDRCETKKSGSAVFGCGHQYITKEAANEKLPYMDEQEGIYYTADCILDNRDELMEKLNINDPDIADGSLLLSAYQRWGEKLTDEVLGVFSFVIYHKDKNICRLYTDHTGCRCLYYYVVEHTLYFSTIFAPLLAVIPEEKIQINEKWILSCEMTSSANMMMLREITPFDHIYLVEAGHSVTIAVPNKQLKLRKRCYWSSKNSKRIKCKSQEEYKELFLSTLHRCVKDVLRSSGNTGVTLSSGLDSSSVACTASRILEKEHRKLYSFTSVPLSEYSDDNTYYRSNESEGVKIICKAYPNIIPEFVACENKNAFTELNRLVHLLELPHKSRQNIVWLDEIYERAAKKNCRIVLIGQYGNATISYGKILSRVYDDFCHLRWVSAYREISLFCKHNRISRMKALKAFLLEMINKIFKLNHLIDNTMVNKGLLDRYNLLKTVKRKLNVDGGTEMDSRRQRLSFLYDINAFTQLGAYETRFGLMHGIIIRDPLKDKRMIELCSGLPMKCFSGNGVERALVRRFMRGIVPDEILDDVRHRGLQGADFEFRIKKEWDSIGKKVRDTVMNPKLQRYMDDNKMKRLVGRIETGELFSSEEDMINVMMLCSCSVFLNEFSSS